MIISSAAKRPEDETMTGNELINWIKENKAEDLLVIIEHRDSGGSYHTGEQLEDPALCRFSDENYGVINRIVFGDENPNAICL